MIPQKAIKKFTKPSHREIVVGHLLAYGFFPSTSDGIDKAKRFVDGLDEWIAPSNLPDYYDEIESDLMTGKETVKLLNIKDTLDEFYFRSKKEPEAPVDIPVEVEVVEVEQKTVDEPIVVKIEAPFEPEPEKKREAPKRIRLPRRSGVITKRPTKKSTATRMAEAFDKRLDDLVDAVQNPPAPAQPKKRKQKESLVKIKKKVKPAKFKSRYKESGNVKPFENLGKFTFNKVKSAFGRAADARRMAQEQGLPEQGKGYYAFRSLGFEFGGDRIARTRGTFSKSPDATLDPSLSKQQRYTEGLFGTRSIRPAKGGGKFDGLTKQFKKLDDALKNVIDTKKESPDSSETTKEFNKTVAEIRDALKKGNKLDQSIVDSKKEQEKIARDAANDAEMGAKEASIEGTEDTAGLGEIEKKAKEEEKKKDDKGPGFNFKWLKNLRRNFGKWWRRIKNPGKTLQAVKRLAKQKLKKIPGVKQLNNWMKRAKPLQGLRNGADDIGKALNRQKDDLLKWGDDIFKKGRAGVTKFGDDALKYGDEAFKAGKAGIAKFGDDVFKGASKWGDDALKLGARFGDDAMRLGGRVGDWILSSPIAKRIGVATGKYGGRMVPVAGTAFSAADAADRISRGDTTGAWLASLGGGAGLAATVTTPAAATGAGAAVPAALEAGSIIADTSLLVYDIFNAVTGREFTADNANNITPAKDSADLIERTKAAQNTGYQPRSQMSEGGVVKLAEGGVNAMVGEAGPELVTNGPGGVNPLQSLAPMIVAMREITKRAGTWADPIENMVRQVTDPIAKQLKLPVLPATVDIGSGGGGGEIKEQDGGDNTGKKKGKGFIGDIAEFFKGMGGKIGGAAATPFAGDVNMGGGAGTTTAGAVYNYLLSKGMSENHAKGITANISRESGFKLGAHNPNDPGAGSFGLFQWNGGRAQRMMAAVPDWQTNWQGQIDYALGEDHGPRYLSTQFGSAGEAAYDWMKYWERPAEYVQAKYTPAAYEGMINKMGLHRGMPVAPPAPAAQPASPSQQPAAQPAGQRNTNGATPQAQAPSRPQPAVPPVTPQPAPPTTTGTGTALLPLLTQPAALTPQQPTSAFTLGNPFVSLPGTSLTQLQLLRLAQ